MPVQEAKGEAYTQDGHRVHHWGLLGAPTWQWGPLRTAASTLGGPAFLQSLLHGSQLTPLCQGLSCFKMESLEFSNPSQSWTNWGGHKGIVGGGWPPQLLASDPQKSPGMWL